MDIMYVLSKPRRERDTMMLNARVDPSWIRQRTAQMADVAYTELKGISHFRFIFPTHVENGSPLSLANANISREQVASAVMFPR